MKKNEKIVVTIEDIGVNGVVANGNGVFPQEALPCQIGKPLRGCDQGHVGHACKQFLFSQIIAVAVIQQQAGRILLFFGTVVAAGLPAVASGIVKVRAVSRKAPAIVERPLHLHIRSFFDPLE